MFMWGKWGARDRGFSRLPALQQQRWPNRNYCRGENSKVLGELSGSETSPVHFPPHMLPDPLSSRLCVAPYPSIWGLLGLQLLQGYLDNTGCTAPSQGSLRCASKISLKSKLYHRGMYCWGVAIHCHFSWKICTMETSTQIWQSFFFFWGFPQRLRVFLF